MLRTNPRQISFYSVLYHNIPENHILKLINSAISLNFVNNALKDSYCSNFGRLSPFDACCILQQPLVQKQAFTEKSMDKTKMRCYNIIY